jgi:hypothetical protein
MTNGNITIGEKTAFSWIFVVAAVGVTGAWWSLKMGLKEALAKVEEERGLREAHACNVDAHHRFEDLAKLFLPREIATLQQSAMMQTLERQANVMDRIGTVMDRIEAKQVKDNPER